MQKNCICICGAVKDCSQWLNLVLCNIEQIGSVFNNYKIIMYYDKSDDDTLAILEKYSKKNSAFTLLINQNHDDWKDKPRTHKIANARNKCLEEMRRICPKYEYFAMIDCDDVCAQPVQLHRFIKNLKRNDWDALSFNSNNYYDQWAVSLKHLPYSVWHFEQPNALQIYQDAVKGAIERTPNGELTQVLSAFNGFAIYRTKLFVDAVYDGNARLDLIPPFLLNKNIQTCGPVLPYFWSTDRALNEQKETDPYGIYDHKKLPQQDCEHRSFHLYGAFVNGARIRISPDIIF